MNVIAETIKKGRKFDQVIEGARAIFMRDGFEGANVDDIAKAAGVSKATLYSYFPDKRVLFAEVARQECERQSQSTISVVDTATDPREAISHIAWAMVEFVTSDFGINVFRICVAESARFPELGCQFYDSGPKLVRERVGEYLSCAVAQGHFEIDDVELAAEQLMELTKTYIFPRILCGIQLKFSMEEKKRIVDGAVDMFMARYAAKA
ncbi:HTH-type transcriptional regulator LuxR [Pseudoruegeria aquimaris]|uniref:HTH-type transcriptional regulator LuxR n=1 Tax=Pseudoruegeria aquimaris TaxID=393663 RepID=A0A1Y5SUW8_9RHOB|nr:TetR/AcrR family transcriptional regulator [Pseudoruegeria aquimaris]SLN48875.1 HTH-type transcriptional regulator LuxR [Pseudoruegeria aquimaris]